MEKNNKPENPKVYARPHSEYVDFNINSPEEQKVIRPAQEGITLRDHFAGLAMNGFLSACNLVSLNMGNIAELSYQMADAMLTERQKEK